MNKTFEQVIDEIRSEDELPSEAGQAFRWLLGYEETSLSLGYRELEIIKRWLALYLAEPSGARKELDKAILKL